MFDVRLMRSMKLTDGSTAIRGSLLRVPAPDAARLIREGVVMLADDSDMPTLLREMRGTTHAEH
jgi:hypothetical protein